MIMKNYGFFNYMEGDSDTYKYNAEEFSHIIGAVAGNGVNYKEGGKLACVASGLSVSIASGGVWVNGHYGYNTEETTLTLTPATSAGRKDYICAHLDNDGRTVEIIQVEGTATDYPTLNEDYVILFAADVNGSSVVLTDNRTFNYGSANEPAAFIVYSATTPAVIEGGIWLKPV